MVINVSLHTHIIHCRNVRSGADERIHERSECCSRIREPDVDYTSARAISIRDSSPQSQCMNIDSVAGSY